MRAEVRIGNLVTDEFYDTFKKEIIVDSINQEGINLTAGDDGKPYGMHHGTIEVEYEFEKLRGIPLTEEWLKRFGFKHAYSSFHDGIFIYVQNGFRIVHQNEAWWLDGEFEFKQKPIDFVHQIQNLYHCLIGEELKLN